MKLTKILIVIVLLNIATSNVDLWIRSQQDQNTKTENYKDKIHKLCEKITGDKSFKTNFRFKTCTKPIINEAVKIGPCTKESAKGEHVFMYPIGTTQGNSYHRVMDEGYECSSLDYNVLEGKALQYGSKKKDDGSYVVTDVETCVSEDFNFQEGFRMPGDVEESRDTGCGKQKTEEGYDQKATS
jgi:hypothetical protein